MTLNTPLPIDALRATFLSSDVPVVITSPTGSGKSTQVPRWCEGNVLVIEPRRLACRALASRVAELEGTPLGHAVGYSVRDEHRAQDGTRVLFATPGIALRMSNEWSRFSTVVLDEFHERSLDTDLLLALFQKRFHGRLVVMSATLDGDRVASHLHGLHLRAQARTFPVAIRHVEDNETPLPDPRNLEERLHRALDACAKDPGDVLVFLPGKGEIADCARSLRNRADVEVLALHGDLGMDAQRKVFAPGKLRRLILATNVAETSVTLPNIGVVIDAGLVRQTRYREGRASLVLVPIARDSADQRAGRAGRVAPGVCYRLWSPNAKLAPATLPEMHRESLVPLVLAAAACGETPESLPLLDPPRDHAIAHAREELHALGALERNGTLTVRGKELFGLPLDAHLGRLLVESRTSGALEDVVDLVAVLSTGRPLFVGRESAEAGVGLRGHGCDATACILALRSGDAESDGVHRTALDDARRTSARLRRAHNLPERGDPTAVVNRERIARTALAADPRCVHVVRRHGREVVWSNGGTEVALGRESAVIAVPELEAIAVIDSRMVGDGRDATVIVTCATPLKLAWLVEAKLGRDKLAAVSVERGRVVGTIERVYARRVLSTREEVPEGEVAREAIGTLFLRGSIFRESLAKTKERLAATALAVRLMESKYIVDADWKPPALETLALEVWVRSRVETLGIERGDELSLLSANDLLAPDIPDAVRESMDREFPRSVTVGDAMYEADYDLARQQVTLRMVRGSRKDPPPLNYLPRFPGFRICVETARAMKILRQGG